jgi:Skp family chaperone for outer membrane proteins
MRAFLAALALACAMSFVASAPAQRLAFMSASDVVNAKRCAPPFGCKTTTKKLCSRKEEVTR